MKTIVPILLTFLVTACQLKNEGRYNGMEGSKSLPYEVILDVRPSFTSNVLYTIKKQGDTCYINGESFAIENEDAQLQVYFSELGKVIAEHFHKKEYKEDHGRWTDGTPVTITIILNKKARVFEFDNSGKNSLLNKLVPPLYSIVHYVNKSDHSKFKLTEDALLALELSEATVIDFPIRKLASKPLKYRLYGRVYSCCIKEVHALLDSFDKDEICYIEVSRQYSINSHDEFHDIFVEHIAKSSNLRWIIDFEQKSTFLKLGVPEEYMIVNE